MSIRSEREKSKMQEKYQLILAQMLKEDDNRFCVDCDSKSPRWTSWNLGIFICIRCAGFHRNLGVHISKVKSVNLDSWTPEQIASMQAMGNNRARATYEANVPAGFRRPQTDSALESFIRAKYEQRKWIAKDWIPPEITVSSDLIESETNQRKAEIPSNIGQVERSTNNNIPKLKLFAAPVSTNNPVRQSGSDRSITTSPSTTSIPTPTQPVFPADLPDLLGLDEPTLPLPYTSSNNIINAMKPSPSDITDPLRELFTTSNPVNLSTTTNETMTNLEKDFQTVFLSSNDTSSSGLMSNDRIMALFNTPQISTPTASGINIRPATLQPPNIPPTGFPQQPHLLGHQKSASFGSNLYQQSNNFGPRPGFQQQRGYPFPPRPGMSTMNHNNPSNVSSPTLQTPSSTFPNSQLNDQFSQFVPFANTKSNTSASALISTMPSRPVTEYMPASSNLLWQ